MTNRNIFSYIIMMVAVTLWGLSFMWTNELLLADVPVFTLVFFRMGIAAIILVVFSLSLRKFRLPARRDLKWFFLMAFFEPFIYFIGETFGMKYTGSPTLVSVIVCSYPVFAMLMDRFMFHTRMKLHAVFGMVLTVPGVVLMVLKDGAITSEYWWGIGLLFMAVLGSLGYAACVRKLSAYNSYTIATCQFLIAALYFLPLFLIFDSGSFDASGFFTRDILVPLFILAAFCSCVAFSLYIECIKNLGITRAAVFTALIPLVSAIGVYLMGQETLNLLQIIGMVSAVAGVILVNRR